jgi:2-dehydro-3-deoxyphosphooctonate aldolase (KDO 8-P synthase)
LDDQQLNHDSASVFAPLTRHVSIGEVQIGGTLPFVLICGPCQMESEAHCIDVAGTLVEISKECGIEFVFKTSFDKANRSSSSAKRGLGFEKSIGVFDKIRKEIGCPVLTDVHEPWQCEPIANVVDAIQIPAFLCRQTDLLLAAGKCGKPVNIKKGTFLSPWDMQHVTEKIRSTGNNDILVCERGACFGYNNLVNDFRSLPVMQKLGYPVVFDATHSVQQPGALGHASNGQREFVAPLARAAVAVGVSAILIEAHEKPEQAPSDGPCMLSLQDIPSLILVLKKLDAIIKNR